MSCNPNQAKDQILTVLKTVWDTLHTPPEDPYELKYDDLNKEAVGTDAGNSIWGRVTIRHGDAFQSSLTGPLEEVKRWTNLGAVTVQVFAPSGDGMVKAYDACQKIAQAFRKSRGIQVWFRRVRVNEAGEHGPYQQVNV